jgi:hypothetical protein
MMMVEVCKCKLIVDRRICGEKMRSSEGQLRCFLYFQQVTCLLHVDSCTPNGGDSNFYPRSLLGTVGF